MSISGNKIEKVSFRLPRDVSPLLYKIKLKPDLVKCVFSGTESIKVKINKQTNLIVLNAREIEITKATFYQNDNKDELSGTIEIDQSTEKAFILFDKSIEISEGFLNLTFEGALNDQLAGFYRSQYYSETKGRLVNAAVTQFSATHARRAFPCWDEPGIKSQFELTLIAPKERTVLSNTLMVSELVDPDNNELKIVSFKRTPIMSTYLVGFVIGEYDYLEGHTKRGTLIRVFTPIGKSLQGTYSLDCALRALEWLEDYFNIPYPLEKLDHVPIADFAYSAMENWGLITYREVALLADPANTSVAVKQNIARVISHETAHQWFGNLVTMEWWSDLWLKEGFASFMQYLVVEALYPEYEYWKQFCIDASVTALDLDASHKSHPIEVAVEEPAMIASIFDEISYQKGASVVKLSYSWIGDQAFRSGMKNYLTQFAYKNTSTVDLWNCLSKSSGKSVESTMSTWTKQMGFPLITVTITANQDNQVAITLNQSKFTIDGKLTSEEKKVLWNIPITLTTSNAPNTIKQIVVMTESPITFNLKENITDEDWIKLNASFSSFYRVNYPIKMWSSLGRAVKSKILSPVDRLQLIDDLLALNYAGKASIDLLLSFLQNYTDEDDYVPWFGVNKCLLLLNRLLAYTDLQENFHKFGRKFLLTFYEKLGWNEKLNENNNLNLLRRDVINALISFNDPQVLVEAKKRFNQHINGVVLKPDLRSIVYKAMTKCDDETFGQLFKLYNETDLQEEKARIACSLGHANTKERLERVIKFSFSEHVRSQNSWQVLMNVASSPLGRQLAWNFFKQNIDEIKKRYGSHRNAARLIKNLTENFASEEMAVEIANFFKLQPYPGFDDVIYRSIEKIRTNTIWLKEKDESLRKIFSNY